MSEPYFSDRRTLHLCPLKSDRLREPPAVSWLFPSTHRKLSNLSQSFRRATQLHPRQSTHVRQNGRSLIGTLAAQRQPLKAIACFERESAQGAMQPLATPHPRLAMQTIRAQLRSRG